MRFYVRNQNVSFGDVETSNVLDHQEGSAIPMNGRVIRS